MGWQGEGDTPVDEKFYERLVDLEDFHQVMQAESYTEVPDNWSFALTDVRGSTKAIENGRYRDVNALGVASIIGVLNAMRDVELPYVFGGDGATVLVPNTRREAAEQALRGVKTLAREAFGMQLRCGIVPLEDLRTSGYLTKLAAFKASPHTRLAMFFGSGVSQAEVWLKDPEIGRVYEVTENGETLNDFEGFECRWRPVPSVRGTIVSLLILALERDEVLRAETYSRVHKGIEDLIQVEPSRPLKIEKMRFKGIFDDFSIEARVRGGAAAGESVQAALEEARKKTLIARVLGVLGKSAGGYDPQRYKSELVENSDFRKFDETLRMVLDLTWDELQKVRDFLEGERLKGNIAYGTHESEHALMTCLVRSYSGDHVHFVDGDQGGYAMAARELKSQVAHRNSIIVPFLSAPPGSLVHGSEESEQRIRRSAPAHFLSGDTSSTSRGDQID